MLSSLRAASVLCGAWVAAGDGCGGVGQQQCPAGRKNAIYLQVQVQSKLAGVFAEDDTMGEVGGAVKSMMHGTGYLAERMHEHTNTTSDDVSGGRRMPNPSCLDETQQAEIPCDLDQNCDLWGTDFKCRYNVQWDMSDYILDLMDQHGASPSLYKFKLCADYNSAHPEVRRFPWLQSAGTDWRHGVSVEGSIILTMMDQVETWAKNGLQNVLPDALEDFARKGDVDGMKIVPRFMLFGWSKGSTYFLPIGRWRPDLIQAEILLNGCNSRKYAWDSTNMPQQAKNAAVVPFLFYSSKLDHYAGCTWKDTTTEFEKQLKNQKKTYLVEAPCGHHPENCWPVCDYKKLYQDTFWEFVAEAYSVRQPCLGEKKKSKCNDHLCVWDEDDENKMFCEERFPSRLSKSCKKFCTHAEVASCAGMDQTECGGSYRVLPTEEAGANGMFSACKFVDGQCVDSASSFQCFFQEQCEGGAQQPGRTGKGTTSPQEGSYYDAYYDELEETSSELQETA